MTVVIEQNGVIFRLLSQLLAATTKVVKRRIQYGFVWNLETKSLKLAAEIGTNSFQRLSGRHRTWIYPAFKDCARIGLDNIRRVDIDVETNYKCCVCGF
jgi:hypothetical protein